MAYFPMCVDLRGRTVLLVGSGPQTAEKAGRLTPFGAEVIRLETLTEADFQPRPAMVVAGDLPPEEAERIAALCAARGVPLNVVDQPRLCTFTFPSMALRGDVTIAVSTGSRAPAAAACLKERIEQCLPERTEHILNWLADLRAELRQTHPPEECPRLLRQIAAAAFAKGDALTREEWLRITEP